MKTYKIDFSRDEYGYIIIKANSEQEARDLVDTGNYNESDLIYKDGSLQSQKVTEIIN